MSTNSEQIIDLFSQATAKGTLQEREEFLAEACRGKPELRAQLESLLQAHDTAGGFLKLALQWPSTEVLTEKPGSMIGRYTLLQKIGEGGCGVVYMAEQEAPIRRVVALKVIKSGMDTRAVIARFESERQTLAFMQHPGIAAVYDAGATETGRPYFVMELVRGMPITDYCEENKLPTRERLDLFVQVCHAVQHAHEKGVIHRDLKPSNILVTQRNGVPIPVIIDFGIAKVTRQPLASHTTFTQFESLLGTPAYMSPEQADTRTRDVDTRSDIYSLGVLLYELLTGTAPFEGRALLKLGFDEMRRTIRETEPEKPSTRLAHCSIATPRPFLVVASDLDWIVMKALEKDRARRFASASEFASDIIRHCHDEPITARPPSTAYRVQRFVRKHKGPFAAATALAATIVLLGSLSLWQGLRAQQQAKRVRANSILLSAAAATDPLLKAQLLLELADSPELPGMASVAREVAERPLPLAIFRGHEYTVKCAAVSPDGERIVTGSRDGTARLWRVDGTEQPVVLRHQNGVWSVAFSPDGKFLVTGTGGAAANIGPTNAADRYLACLWRTADARGGSIAPTILRGHEGGVRAVAFSSDGQRLVTGSEDGTARIWRTDGTGEPIVLRGHEGEIRSAAFSPDGTLVVTASDDRTARIWRTDGQGEPVILEGHMGRVNTAAFSPNGTQIVTASVDDTARTWHVDGREIALYFGGTRDRLESRYKGINSAFFGRNGRQIFGVVRDGSARVWEADGSGEFDMLEGMGGEVSRVVFSPDGSHVAAAVVGNASVARSGERPHRVAGGHEHPISILAFSPDNRRLVTVSDDSIRVWRVDRKHGPVTLGNPSRQSGASCFAFSPDGSRVVVASPDSTVRIWSVDGMGDPILLPTQEAPALVVRFSRDGRRVATFDADGIARFWPADGKGGAVVSSQLVEVSPKWSSWSADGRQVLACAADKILRLYPVDPPGPPRVLSAPEGEIAPCMAAFSPDGTHVAVADLNGSACVWRTEGKGQPVVFRGHLDEVLSIAFSPDGERIVSTSTDGTVRIWRTANAQELVVLRGHHGWVTSAAFSPNGTQVATGAGLAGPEFDDTVRIWPADGRGEPMVIHAGDGIRRVTFSPEGTRVAAALQNGTVRIWQITWPELLSTLRANVRAPLSPEQRINLLGETAGEAWENYAAAESRAGRKPQAAR